METCFVYMTAESESQAREIGRTLIEERLAACVNVIDGMKSLYWWQDKVEEGAESVVIAKTRETLVTRLTERVKQVHSYECPCVVTLSITGGNADFLSWIDTETRVAAS